MGVLDHNVLHSADLGLQVLKHDFAMKRQLKRTPETSRIGHNKWKVILESTSNTSSPKNTASDYE